MLNPSLVGMYCVATFPPHHCLCVPRGERIGDTPVIVKPFAHPIWFSTLRLNLNRPQEKHTEALPLLERALRIRTKKLGENHPD
ncbi:unnamed protein product, partial [Ectocarpus sp. 8 AP-2014]